LCVPGYPVPGYPHHVTQRGNRRMQTFFGDEDYRAYLALLAEWTGRCGVRVLAYCLMPNHVHLILVPPGQTALAQAVGQTNQRYTRRINFRQNWRGYLWQGRFGSCVMDEPHLLAAAAYVERNPAKAGLVERAEDWPWSSAAGHAAGRGDAVAEGLWLIDRTAGWVCTWAEYLGREDSQQRRCRLRQEDRRPSRPKPDAQEARPKAKGTEIGCVSPDIPDISGHPRMRRAVVPAGQPTAPFLLCGPYPPTGRPNAWLRPTAAAHGTPSGGLSTILCDLGDLGGEILRRSYTFVRTNVSVVFWAGGENQKNLSPAPERGSADSDPP